MGQNLKNGISESRVKYAYKRSDIERVLARRQAPYVQDGVTYLPLAEVARLKGRKPNTMTAHCQEVKTLYVVGVSKQGWRYIRIPRSPDDLRPPIYLDPESVK